MNTLKKLLLITLALSISACSKGLRFSVALEPMTKGEYRTGFEAHPAMPVIVDPAKENPISYSGGRPSWFN